MQIAKNSLIPQSQGRSYVEFQRHVPKITSKLLGNFDQQPGFTFGIMIGCMSNAEGDLTVLQTV